MALTDESGLVMPVSPMYGQGGGFANEEQAENFALLINGCYICPNGDEVHYI